MNAFGGQREHPIDILANRHLWGYQALGFQTFLADSPLGTQSAYIHPDAEQSVHDIYFSRAPDMGKKLKIIPRLMQLSPYLREKDQPEIYYEERPTFDDIAPPNYIRHRPNHTSSF